MLQVAAILAGGLATRLRPLTETIPKSLVEVAGRPFLAHQLELLERNGVKRVVICAGFLAGMIEEYAGDGSRFGVEIQYSLDGPNLRGTAGALRQALPLLGESFLTLYGDSYLPVDYQAIAEAFEASGKAGLMTVFRNDDLWDSSNVEFDGERIVVYDKKNRTPRMRHIDYGLGAFRASALTNTDAADLATVYQELLAAGELLGVEVQQRFYEIGSFSGIEECTAFLTQQQAS
jgi:NDP-sugar pyrophosphorylase family protein